MTIVLQHRSKDKKVNVKLGAISRVSQQTDTFSKATIETLEKRVRYVQSKQQRHLNDTGVVPDPPQGLSYLGGNIFQNKAPL